MPGEMALACCTGRRPQPAGCRVTRTRKGAVRDRSVRVRGRPGRSRAPPQNDFIESSGSRFGMPKCRACGGGIAQSYMPMKEWKMEGPICGRCYSEKIFAHYPGDHPRMDTGKS